MTVLGKTILQGSVATHLRCGEIISDHLTTNFLQNPSVKNFENRLRFDKVIRKSLMLPFLRHSVVYCNEIHRS